jgi:hypothetical protein
MNKTEYTEKDFASMEAQIRRLTQYVGRLEEEIKLIKTNYTNLQTRVSRMDRF